MSNDEVLQQDMEQQGQHPGMVFVVHLLMEEKCDMPEKRLMQTVMSKHLGDTDCIGHDGKVAGFAVNKYRVKFKDAELPPQLMVMECTSIEQPVMNQLEMSQVWDCPGGAEILRRCQYQVVAVDLLAAGLPYKDRADMLVDYVDALLEIYPSCQAVVFDLSKKMYTREDLLACDVARERKFIKYAVNVRFFKIQGTNDMVVDSLGMSTLFLPDVQYHFRGLDPNLIVNHAYNLLSYLYDYDCPIKSGDTVDGIKDGALSQEIQWKAQIEQSLLQPGRPLLDINTNEFAAGHRS